MMLPLTPAKGLRFQTVELKASAGPNAPNLINEALKTEWQVGTTSSVFGSRRLRYLPFPGQMVTARTNMPLVYVSMDEKSVLAIRDFLSERKKEMEA